MIACNPSEVVSINFGFWVFICVFELNLLIMVSTFVNHNGYQLLFFSIFPCVNIDLVRF